MDDMVITGSNKRKLHFVRWKISLFLKDEFGLELKPNWQVFRFDYIKNNKHYGRFLDFMGFRFYRNKTILRKSIMLKIIRKVNRIKKKNKINIIDARQMISYLGWIKYTNSYLMYEKRIKPYISFQYMKRKISLYDKRRN